MRYLVLIYSDESHYGRISEHEMGQLMAGYQTFADELNQAGALLSAERLKPTAMSTTVRVRDGETLTTDGPFSETKEHLGGFFLIEAKNLDDAIAIAAKCPTATYGSIEVRPIWEQDE